MASKIYRWEVGFDPGFILRRIAEFRTVADGRASFDAHQFQWWLPILNSAVVSKGRGKSFKHDVVRKAVSDQAYDLRRNPSDFLELCEKKLSKITSASLKEYVLFAKVTHAGPRLFRKLGDGDTKIVWDPARNSKFYKAAIKARASEALKFPKQNAEVNDDEDGLVPVLVYVRALNARNAYEIGMEAFDCIRGIINMLVNTQRGINPLAGLSNKPPHAINRIRRGSYQTMHNPDGTLAAEMFWYEARWSHALKPLKFSEPALVYQKVFQRWWKNTIESPLREQLTEGFVRYCRALDTHDQDKSLLELWSALESILGTSKHELVVSRVVKLFDNEAEARQLAEHIRVRRNASVHAADGPEYLEADTVVMQAQILLARTLTFLASRKVPFQSASELHRFLDLPLDSNELGRQRSLIDEFLAFRKGEGKWKAVMRKK